MDNKECIVTFQTIRAQEETLRASGREKGLSGVSMASDFSKKATLNARKPWSKASKFWERMISLYQNYVHTQIINQGSFKTAKSWNQFLVIFRCIPPKWRHSPRKRKMEEKQAWSIPGATFWESPGWKGMPPGGAVELASLEGSARTWGWVYLQKKMPKDPMRFVVLRDCYFCRKVSNELVIST